jgi:hypothetical protein
MDQELRLFKLRRDMNTLLQYKPARILGHCAQTYVEILWCAPSAWCCASKSVGTPIPQLTAFQHLQETSLTCPAFSKPKSTIGVVMRVTAYPWCTKALCNASEN